MNPMDKEHAERFKNALRVAGAIMNDGTVRGDFGASLYILTGLPGVYDQVWRHIHNGWLDFEQMLDLPLSSGERILVALAGNLYNGGFFDGYTPMDIIGCGDNTTVGLALNAIRMRKQKLRCRDFFGFFADEFAAAK